MAPTTVALDVYRGDDHHWTLHLYTDPDTLAPYDLTGAAVKAQIRAVSAGTVRATLGTAVTLPNIVDVTLTGTASKTLPAGKLRWDLQATFAGGAVRTLVAGPVTVTADVTDSDDPVVAPL